ncbi:MAG: pyridoxal-phosphate dependent enzyme [Pseudomonadota bacterium]
MNLPEIEQAASWLESRVLQTPAREVHFPGLEALSSLTVKMECLQTTGSFKLRGALLSLKQLDEAQKRRGVVAVSAGNHAIATACAAQMSGVSARVVMPVTASMYRVARCRDYGVEPDFEDDIHQAFATAERICESEGRAFVHPFNSREMVLGSATLGLEMLESNRPDVIVIPVGGGGLLAGIALAVRQSLPECQIIGVEPEGADTMNRSFDAGKPMGIEVVRTIADSLGAPKALAMTYEICKNNVDSLVRVSDSEIVAAMSLIHATLDMAVEPACAASTAAVLGPLRDQLEGKNVQILFCGSNYGVEDFQQRVAAA